MESLGAREGVRGSLTHSGRVSYGGKVWVGTEDAPFVLREYYITDTHLQKCHMCAPKGLSIYLTTSI